MNPQPMTLAEMKAPKHTERFEVVLLDKKKALGDALPKDFRRVAITAESPLEAQAHKQIIDLSKEWTVIGCVAGGHILTEEEKAAQRLSQRMTSQTAPAQALPNLRK